MEGETAQRYSCYLYASLPPIAMVAPSAAALLLGLLVRIPSGHGCHLFKCRVLSGTDLCFRLITRTEESYRVQCVRV